MSALWSSSLRHAASGQAREAQGMGLEAGKMWPFGGQAGAGMGWVEKVAQRMFNPLFKLVFPNAQTAVLRGGAGAATVGSDAGCCFSKGGEGGSALRLVRLLYPFGRKENFHIAQTMMTPRFTTHRRKSPAKKNAGRLLDGREWNEFPKVERMAP